MLAELGLKFQNLGPVHGGRQLAKDKGYTGVFIAGKDSRQPANLMDIAATTFLASCEDKGYTAQLADGSFDWNNWTPVSQLLMDLKAKGYLNVDCVTCDPVDAAPRMAENNILFLMSSSPDLIGQAQEINPEAKYGHGPHSGAERQLRARFLRRRARGLRNLEGH